MRYRRKQKGLFLMKHGVHTNIGCVQKRGPKWFLLWYLRGIWSDSDEIWCVVFGINFPQECVTVCHFTYIMLLHYLVRRKMPIEHVQLLSCIYRKKLLWLPNPPDLNPVEYSVWGILQEKMYKACITDLDELKQQLRTEWAKLDHVVAADRSRPVIRVLYTFPCSASHNVIKRIQIWWI